MKAKVDAVNHRSDDILYTMRHEGFLDSEIVRILGSKSSRNYYGIDNSDVDQAAAAKALDELLHAKRARIN